MFELITHSMLYLIILYFPACPQNLMEVVLSVVWCLRLKPISNCVTYVASNLVHLVVSTIFFHFIVDQMQLKNVSDV